MANRRKFRAASHNNHSLLYLLPCPATKINCRRYNSAVSFIVAAKNIILPVGYRWDLNNEDRGIIMQPQQSIERSLVLPRSSARCILWLGFVGCCLLYQQAVAEEQHQPVQYEITPYLWAATIDGTLAADGDSTPPIDSDYSFFSLDNLDGVASATFSAHGTRWGFLFDFLYIAYEDTLLEGSRLQVKPRLEGRVIEFAATYRPVPDNDLHLIAGIRQQDIEFELTFLDRTTPASVDWIDPFAGVLYSHALTNRLNLSLRGDIGGFGINSERVLNAEAMLRYRPGKLFSFKFGYRYLEVEFKDNDLVYDLSLGGFLFGLGIHF
jgi:hypothetical protein